MSIRKIVLLSLMVLGAACGGDSDAERPVSPPSRPPPTATAQLTHEEVPVTPDAPFRAAAPKGGPAPAFVPPAIVVTALKNKMPVYIVERHDLPIVSVRVVSKMGIGVAGARPGAMSCMGALLEQGTKKKSAVELGDAYDAIGAQHGSWFDWDAGGVFAKVTTDKLQRALELVAETVKEPAFKQEEIDRDRDRRLNSLKQQKQSPGIIAQNTLAAVIYGREHPYGNSVSGREDDVKAIKRDDLVRLHRDAFSLENVAIVVAGDVTKDGVLPLLESSFGDLKRGGKKAGAPPPAPKQPAPKQNGSESRLVFVDKPGASQSQIFVAELGIAETNPDRDAVSVMNAILGGMFTSRINLNLREKNAYTYGARSFFARRSGPGPFAAGGAIFAEKTAPAVTEIFTELRRMVDEKVTEDELQGAKDYLRLTMPARFETVSSVTEAAADLFVYGFPADEFVQRIARIEKVTADDVQKMAAKYIHPSTMRVLIVGDMNKVKPSLEALHLGAGEVRDSYGDPVK
jgi:zinc protease